MGKRRKFDEWELGSIWFRAWLAIIFFGFNNPAHAVLDARHFISAGAGDEGVHAEKRYPWSAFLDYTANTTKSCGDGTSFSVDHQSVLSALTTGGSRPALALEGSATNGQFDASAIVEFSAMLIRIDETAPADIAVPVLLIVRGEGEFSIGNANAGRARVRASVASSSHQGDSFDICDAGPNCTNSGSSGNDEIAFEQVAQMLPNQVTQVSLSGRITAGGGANSNFSCVAPPVEGAADAQSTLRVELKVDPTWILSNAYKVIYNDRIAQRSFEPDEA